MSVFPTMVLEVNWNGDGSTFVDETARILSVNWELGRDYASQLTGRSIAGKLTAVLRNADGRFASFNASGALYGSLLPGREVRWRATAPSAQTLWIGFLAEIRPSRARGDIPTATLAAYGPLYWIGDRLTTVAVQASIATGAAIEEILDDAGWPAADRTIDTGQITITRWQADRKQALTALREIEATELLGLIRETRDGKIAWEDAHHRLLTPHTTSQATFSDASGAALPFDEIEQLDPWREVYNRFEADVTTFTVQGSATLWTVTGETPDIAPGATRDFWARYPNPDSATQADHVDAWTTPVENTDYEANSQADGLGTDLSASLTVVVTKFATAMKIAITNTAAVRAYLTTLQARGTAVYKNDPIGVAVEDATSQTAYGKRTYPADGPWFADTQEALDFLNYGLSRYKDPTPVLRVGFPATMSSDHLTQALARTVSERITVKADATTESGAQLGIDATDFFIEREQHEYDLSGWRVRYDLSDAEADAGYWALGISTLGETTRLNV